MSSNALVSVIVPVYKVEEYLVKCVDSILGQSYRDLEVILVDDGSPDSCGEMCEEFARKDARVKVIHQKNGGLSAARNTGLCHASGEYVLFVDSDDYIALDLLEDLLKHAEDGVDVLLFDHCEVTSSGEKIFGNKWFPGISSDEIKRRIVSDQIYNSAWGKLFRRRLWDGLEFPVGLVYEDLYVMPSVVVKAGEVRYVDLGRAGSYYNRLNPGAITAPARDNRPRNRYDRSLALEEHRRVAEEMGWSDIASWAEAKAVQEMIRALYANEASPELADDKVAHGFAYLERHRSASSLLNAKYKFLLWAAFSFPSFNRFYGSLRLRLSR